MSKDLHKRALADVFLNDFLKDGVLSPLLKLVDDDHTLCMELRGDNVVIYYRGGLLYKIVDKGNSVYKIYFNNSYKNNGDNSYKEIVGNNIKDIVDNAVAHIAEHKHDMDLYFSHNPKMEREFQQLIVRENNFAGAVSKASDYFILDIEYAFNEKSGNTDDMKARFDMLAVKWISTGPDRKNGKNLPMAFIEVKYGDGAVNGVAGIDKHIKDYITFRKDKDRMKQLAEDMEKVFNQKHKLDLIKGYKEKELNITIDSDNVEYVFIFANHDPDKTNMSEEIKAAIATWKKPGTEDYLKEIKVAKASEMGYGLFAYKKGKEYLYPTIEEYVNALENNANTI